MCLSNKYDTEEGDYRNGTLGTVIDLHPDHIIIEKADGKTTKVGRQTVCQYAAEVDGNGEVVYNPKASFTQIDCKPCRACTIHRAQGKTLDAAYLQLSKWTPEGLLYVALSRTREITELGISRPITKDDVCVNEEAWDFLQIGNLQSAPPPVVEPDWNGVVGEE
jgi:ATP-dependent exoDNAse (exonuclease V) alpha subunit